MFVVDTGAGKLSDKVIAAIRTLTGKPIQFIANTSFHAEHTGGNDALGAAGQDPSLPGSFFVQSAPRGVTGFFSDPLSHATMLGHNNVMVRMQAARRRPQLRFPPTPTSRIAARKFHNGDAIELFHMPNATTDGDSLVHFRRADVIVAGDIFTTTQYPFIDVRNGGTVAGLIRALNDILDRTVFGTRAKAAPTSFLVTATVSDEHEVVEYRDMVVIVRDRVKAMIDGGATLAQIQASRVTADYDTRYGANTGPWTTDDVRRGGLRHAGHPAERAVGPARFIDLSGHARPRGLALAQRHRLDTQDATEACLDVGPPCLGQASDPGLQVRLVEGTHGLALHEARCAKTGRSRVVRHADAKGSGMGRDRDDDDVRPQVVDRIDRYH